MSKNKKKPLVPVQRIFVEPQINPLSAVMDSDEPVNEVEDFEEAGLESNLGYPDLDPAEETPEKGPEDFHFHREYLAELPNVLGNPKTPEFDPRDTSKGFYKGQCPITGKRVYAKR